MHLDQLGQWPLETQLATREFEKLRSFVAAERQAHSIFPSAAGVFRAFSLTPYRDVKQSYWAGPLPRAGTADGLAFSVPHGVRLPPSLRNIFKELTDEYPAANLDWRNCSGDLSAWARQGVLLMNTVLTVRQSQANSHQRRGWEEFTDSVIRCLAARGATSGFHFVG